MRKALATCGTNIGIRRRAKLALMPASNHLLEKGLKVKADLLIDRALKTKPSCTINTAQNAAV